MRRQLIFEDSHTLEWWVISLHGERGTGTVLKKRRSAKASKRQMAPKRQSVSKRQSFKAPHAKKRQSGSERQHLTWWMCRSRAAL